MYIGQPVTYRPTTWHTALQERTYDLLDRLGVSFLRVDTEDVITMEDCRQVDAALQVRVVKTLFLCNRQQTQFYLCVMPGDKPFITRDFGQVLGVSRVSFAPAEMLKSMLQTEPGGTSLFSLLADEEQRVRFIIDRPVLQTPFYGCTDTTYYSYMRLQTDDVTRHIIPALNHTAEIVEL